MTQPGGLFHNAIFKGSRLFVALCLLLSIKAVGSSAVLAQETRGPLKVEYNSQKDLTQITLDPFVLTSRKLEELRLGAVTGYPGKTKSQPKEVALIFLSLSPLESNKYEAARKLTITADGQRIVLGPMQYAKQSQNGLFIESMTTGIPFESFLRVCRSKEVRIKLGFAEVTLSPKQITLLQAFASYATD
jgi:hypothetical protein